MSRSAKPWYWKERKTWCVTIEGTRHNLGPKKSEALQRFHELMIEPPPKPVVVDNSVHAIFELFLEWVQKHRSPATYGWYRERLDWFAKTIAASMRVSAAESCYDNAFMESCFGTVKTELELVEYANSSEVVRELSNYIRYYNGSRRHSSLEYVSPATFESQLTVQR